ncbi:hypothetical protein FOL47_003740 [Perkinsus chesapeaki]|uniref:RRM domain-containing protein n=1 Tax=Perkinsus chesapeaki TaxID=330153 RepID=A0A7J6M6G8_PERCH|nr:hypothetical protein FOL47_003740 [Perkinsus chesapeaki]
MSALASAAPGGNSIDQMARTVYVGGLEEQVDKTVIMAAFQTFGEIKKVELPIERGTSKHRGFAFVEFYEEGDAKDAVDNMNESELYGRTLRVNMARQPGSSGPDPHKPIWADEFLYRQKLVEQSSAQGGSR